MPFSRKLSGFAPSLLLLTALSVPPPLVAQETGLLVRARSADGPARAVAVALFRQDSLVWSGTTGREGWVRILGVPPGTYRLQVDALGYRLHTAEEVRVRWGEMGTVQVELELAPVELEGILVWADSRIQIQRESTDFHTTVDEQALELLPVAYDPGQIVAFTPGARPEHVWGGANVQANSYRFDGLAANHPGLGGSFIEPSTLWIDRVEVRGLGAGAEHGGFQGGQVNIITKRGTNDFFATLRTMVSDDALAGSNLVQSEIGSEVKTRYDVEGEIGGVLVPDRLFYYAAGSWVDRSARFLNHGAKQGRYAPMQEELLEWKAFGKLTWTPGLRDEIEASGAWLGTRVENHGMTGYEASGAALRLRAPTWFGNLAWRRSWGERAVVEAQVNHFQRDERAEPYEGTGTPGVRLFSLIPPYNTFGNAPFTRRSAPSSTSATLTSTFRFQTGAREHLLKIGGEYSRGRFLDRRSRNGGMTWMPVDHPALDPGDPLTWGHPQDGFIPTEWGGQVHLDAEVMNAAAFAQGAVSLGRLVLTPGVRWSAWTGWLEPRTGARFRAVGDQAFDPRLGATLELSADGSWILKGHWGRYHQDMITQMFDRAGGSDAFTDQEIWYYRGEPPTGPGAFWTEAQRDALAGEGIFTRESVVSLNETGPVVDYDQPYVDQWLVGIQKQFGRSAQFEALYTRRSNHDMIALVDRNRDANYTLFERVRVHMGGIGGGALPFSGGSVYIHDLYIPNHVVVEELRRCALQAGDCHPPPGLAFADTLSLSWNPDYVLTNAPNAARSFQQLQLTFKFARPRWGGLVSAALTGLEGNLDDVSGYEDPSEFSPGPYVRINEGVNAYGTLPNFAERELKLAFWGVLPWDLRGGAFLTARSGDHYSPRFRISGQGSFYGYVANAESWVKPCNPIHGECKPPGGDPLPMSFFQPLEGHEVFIGPRGRPEMPGHATLDLRLERIFSTDRFDVGIALDVFNALGSEKVVEVQDLVNHGERFHYFFEDTSSPFRKAWAGKWYQSPLKRVSPRRLRLGTTVYF